MSFELLSHPADARFRATGATLEEAFAESTRAFAAISEGGGDDSRRFEIEVESEDRQALLFDYLAELVLLQELEGVAVSRAEGVEIEERGAGDGYALRATVLAGPIGEPLFDVKSPTYSEMRVERVPTRSTERASDASGDDASRAADRSSEWVLEATLDI
ncbi:archease [Halomarina halobia]|uniref:Archease n=1 Tax=Halomarina halobia TaxID=3033386 RepID=A0ABD6A9H1_9EURY|nr:archease [Halomarina sp. PSR21]